MVLSKGYEIPSRKLDQWNWQEQWIHFSQNQSWIRVQNSNQISLRRRGFSEYFWLFMLKMRWKISLPQRVIILNWKFILRNIQTGRDSNISLTLAAWSPGLLSPFYNGYPIQKRRKKAQGSKLWLSQKKNFSCCRLFFWLQRGNLLASFWKYIVAKPLKYWNTCPIHPQWTQGA